MKKKIFGFDLGIASIGWSAVEFDNEYFNIETGEVIDGRILGAGVRTFPVAENPKDGASLAAPRREKRLARRICRRKARRLCGIKKMFIAKGLVANLTELNDLFEAKKRTDVWDLRVEALSRQLSKDELLRVLIHLAKHRGFKSYRKAVEEKDEEGGKILTAININKALLSGNKTLAQVIVERAGKNGKKRNYKAKNEKGKEETIYINSIPRVEIERELDLIFQAQKHYGIFREDLYRDFKRLAFRFRPIGSVGDMVGYCSFEKDEKRAPKNAPTSEIFVALSKINNLTIYEDNQKRFLNEDERSKLLQLLQSTQKVKYLTIAKKVFKDKEIKFSDINYATKPNKKGDIKETNPEDKLFYEMKGWHKIKSVLSDEEWNTYRQNIPLLDKIVTAIACEKNDDAISTALKDLGLDQDMIVKFIGLDFDKFINLSLKALYKIVPYMQDGLTYDKACAICGYKDVTKIVQKRTDGLLPAILQENQTTVPVVNRTVSQFRKVYNAMVRRYGIPDQINIETGRELKKSFKERKEIEKKNQDNETARKEAGQELREKNINDNSTNILKWRLYQEQDGKCIYSGKPIDLNRLDETGYLEVDHIIPYSRSLDNSYDNKVLCLSAENQKKSSKTPFEYLGGDINNWEEFCGRVKSMQAMRPGKKEKLLTKTYANREQEFRQRNANDNSHIARYVKKYLEDGIDFSQSSRQDIKSRVQMRSGFLTDYLRHCWGLKKDRDENDRHHAQDAIVIACATQGMVSYLSSVSHFKEDKWSLTQQNGEAWYKSLKHKFDEPWSGFRADVETAIDNIFVSRPPRKNATGEIHQETIRPLNPKHKNFSAKDIKSGIHIRGGLANNGGMLRTDVFCKKNSKGKDEFYLVPIYLSDLGKDLPNKAIVAYKDENDWLPIDDSFEFKFSCYADDLIKVTKGNKVIFGYFKGTGRTTASITIEAHDRSVVTPSVGVKTQDKFQKYTVDVLGNYTEVKNEKRLSLKMIKPNAQRYHEKQSKK